jgi:hypothetical protein
MRLGSCYVNESLKFEKFENFANFGCDRVNSFALSSGFWFSIPVFKPNVLHHLVVVQLLGLTFTV